MTTRRDALTIAPLLFLQAAAASHAQGQTAQAGNSPVFQHDLPNVTMDGWEVTVSEISVPPGYSGKAHHHPGFVLVYVLEGAVVTKISGSEEKTYSAGQMFYEAPGSTHEVNRNASETRSAKFIALILAKKGLPLTTPA
jgi:quercetin dioxygenase-like cupin family protein